jgi:hypothetical protein
MMHASRAGGTQDNIRADGEFRIVLGAQIAGRILRRVAQVPGGRDARRMGRAILGKPNYGKTSGLPRDILSVKH